MTPGLSQMRAFQSHKHNEQRDMVQRAAGTDRELFLGHRSHAWQASEALLRNLDFML